MPDDLTPANPQDLRLTISYALRFGDTGKPHRTAMDDMTHLAADIIARHLERSGYVVLKRPPRETHSVPPERRGPPLKP